MECIRSGRAGTRDAKRCAIWVADQDSAGFFARPGTSVTGERGAHAEPDYDVFKHRTLRNPAGD